MIGSETPTERHAGEAVAAAFPDARVVVLEGQGHVADLLAPALVAEQLLPFLGERP
jgi:pimeloyl-ACP methyl ester carboxylesterase